MSINQDQDKYELPNGQKIQHVNSYETDFVFNEIFVDEVYLKHGIKIDDHAIIFDVGANIGLFSLYIKQKFSTSQIYTFEPSPIVYPILKQNLASFGDNIKIYNLGLGNNEEECSFYYYPGYSVISGFHVNKQRDMEIIMSGIRTDNVEENLKIESLIKQRFEQLHAFRCQITTLSKIIQKNTIEKIDLLKIDTEGSELAILKGINEEHWHKIQQMVIEVHSKKDLVAIKNLLKNKPFNVYTELDKQLKSAEVYNLFVTKK